MQQLRSQGLTLLNIREAGTSLVAEQATQFKNLHGGQSSRLSQLLANKNVTQADILVMSSELSIMLKAGLALDNALRVLIGMNTKPAMMALTQTLLADVKSGQPLSKALGKHPQQFSDFYINMIRSGEASGQISAGGLHCRDDRLQFAGDPVEIAGLRTEYGGIGFHGSCHASLPSL
jgi:general secretion pathway protein F